MEEWEEMKDEEQRVREEKREKEKKNTIKTRVVLNMFFFVEFVQFDSELVQGTHAIFIHSHADKKTALDRTGTRTGIQTQLGTQTKQMQSIPRSFSLCFLFFSIPPFLHPYLFDPPSLPSYPPPPILPSFLPGIEPMSSFLIRSSRNQTATALEQE